MNGEETFIEIECSQSIKTGESVCGDAFKTVRLDDENRHIAVLSDGLGSGIKACLLASMTTTMALEFIRKNMDILPSAEIIMDTLPVCELRKISYATFSIFDILSGGKVRAIEMDNPKFIHLRNGKDIKWESSTMVSDKWPDRKLSVTEFRAIAGDRIICFSDGVSQAGLGSKDNKFGWRREGALKFIQEVIEKEPQVSARELARKITVEARSKNPDYKYLDDTSCMVIYFRRPRKLQLLTGPPFNEENDKIFAKKVLSYDGKTVLCGGTTANIVSRELNRKITTNLKLIRISGNLPPPSQMEGVDLVTEGILTLTEVCRALEAGKLYDLPLAASELANMLINSDVIELVVGTKVNEAHQDPNLPVDLEIRRNIVKKIKAILEQKYRKLVTIKYY